MARMTDLTGDWKIHLQSQGKSPHTIRLYDLAVRKLLVFLAPRVSGWEEVTPRQLRQFMAGVESSGCSPSHAQTVLYACRSFFGYLADEEGIPSPMARMKGRRVPPVPVPVLAREQLAALVKACKDDRDRYRGTRDEAIIRCLIDAGLRLAEVARLDRACADLGDRPFIRVTGKGGRIRRVPLGGSTVVALRRYARQRARHPRAGLDGLWLGLHGQLTSSGIYKIVRTRGVAAGLDLHPHLLRHSWAHYFRLDGGELDNLVHLAGWSGPQMALRYSASAAEERAHAWARQHSLGDSL